MSVATLVRPDKPGYNTLFHSFGFEPLHISSTRVCVPGTLLLHIALPRDIVDAGASAVRW